MNHSAQTVTFDAQITSSRTVRSRMGADTRLPATRNATGSKRKSVTWSPPEGLTPDEAEAVIDAASNWRDRLLLRTLWLTGGRVSEVLALTPAGIQTRTGEIILANSKNPGRTLKRIPIPLAQRDLLGQLLDYARERCIANDAPIFDISRVQVWRICQAAGQAAEVHVLSTHGREGIHPHLFRHGRVRELVRQTHSLPLAQKIAGWSRLQMAYLSIGDEEARQMIEHLPH